MTLTVLGIGNPLLDYSNEFEADFITEFECGPGAGVLYDPAIHKDIYERMKAMPSTSYLPGGATQNTMRAVASLAQEPGYVGYMGCVGNDTDADTMAKINAEVGLSTWYQRHPTESTGVCAVVVDKKTRDRSMVTKLAAACCFDIDYLNNNWDKVEQASIIYSAGFHVSACAEGMVKVAKHCAQNNKFWAVCLCAEFIVSLFPTQVAEWLKFANLVIGNEIEWARFATQFDLGDISQQDILRHVIDKTDSQCKGPRIAIMTRGPDDTLVAFKMDPQAPTRLEEYPVVHVPKELIKDTNGCGDTFIGGFLYAWSKKQPIHKCVEIGHVCAAEVLQNEGVIFDLAKIGATLTQNATS